MLARILDQGWEGRELVKGNTADIARWAKPLADSKNESPGTFPPGAAQVMLRSKAALRVAAAALSVEQFRRRTGRWPEKLSDVPGPMPADPFTGEPLKLARTDDGCILYSVGTNLTDDGGIGYDQDGDDIVFRLFDPDKRNRP